MDSDADIQGTEAGATGADAAAGAEGGEALDDAAILAEIQASGEGADPEGEQPAAGDPPAADKPKDGEKPAGEDEEGGGKKDPPKDAAADAERRARRILAAANRTLAKARHKERQGVDQIVAGLKSKPLETLRLLGVPIGDVLQSGEREGEAEQPLTVEQRLEKIESGLREDMKKAAEREEQARVDRQIAEKRAEITRDLKAAAADFPLINRGEAFDLVTDTMVEYFGLHGKRCTPAAAAKAVEDYLTKLSGGAAPSGAATSDGKPKPAPQRQGSVTLGNHTRNVAPTGDDWPDDIEARVALAAKELGLNHN